MVKFKAQEYFLCIYIEDIDILVKEQDSKMLLIFRESNFHDFSIIRQIQDDRKFNSHIFDRKEYSLVDVSQSNYKIGWRDHHCRISLLSSFDLVFGGVMGGFGEFIEPPCIHIGHF